MCANMCIYSLLVTLWMCSYFVNCLPTILYEGEECYLSSGVIGISTLFGKCKPVVWNFEWGMKTERFNFYWRQVVVCCPDSRPAVSKSEEACRSYSNEAPLRVNPWIFGGTAAEEGEFPHMAALGYVTRGSKEVSWNCGGTLVSSRYVLTAAHFSEDKSRVLKKVRLGGVNLVSKSGVSQDYFVDKVIRHPQYKGNYNDIALVRLVKSVRFSDNILPACLYTDPVKPPSGLIVTGWGATNALGDQKSSILMKATVQSLPLEQCNATYSRSGYMLRSGVSNDMICGYDPENYTDTCLGDSGGPLQVLVRDLGNVYYVVGVTSLGPFLCGGSAPAVYTKVSSYIPWIENIVWPSKSWKYPQTY